MFCRVAYVSGARFVSIDIAALRSRSSNATVDFTPLPRWWLLLASKWSREGRARALQDAGLPPAPPPCTGPLPWEGTTKILLTILAASLTLALPTQGPATLLLLSLYLFFLLSGLIDVLIFFCGYTVLPEGIQSFILALAFTMEAVVFQAIVPTAPHILLLLLLITSCALSSILEVVFDNKLVKFCRTFFTCVQASWLLHLAFLPSSPLSSTWAALLFSWHLAGLFTIHLVLLLLYSHLTRAPSLPTTLPSPSGSASQLVSLHISLTHIEL